jgi:hypothetical protein
MGMGTLYDRSMEDLHLVPMRTHSWLSLMCRLG